MNIKIIPFFLINFGLFAQQDIGDFISVEPLSQNTNFVIPATHRFQKIIETGDPLTEGGSLLDKNDFTGYVPISGSSENGYLSINAEDVPGGVAILDINYNSTSKLWQISKSQAVSFSSLVGTIANCSGTVTPWNTIITCEEYRSVDLENDPRFLLPRDLNNDGYDDFGWAIEIDPATKTVIDQTGGLNGPDKLWALGNFKHENAVIHSNERTVYQGADAGVGYLYKFVADAAQDLSSGKLYVYKGSKNGSGNWIQLNNATQVEQNTTVEQSSIAGATVFQGIEDIEIGPDGRMYFAVKGEDRVYRFQDSDPISGTTVLQMETYVGNDVYSIVHENGSSNINWGDGNDNLAFDGDGNLWVLQDSSTFQNFIWVVENGHTQSSPKVRIFARTPIGSEPTGITFSPDYRFLFMSIQHPTATNNSTAQTDAAGNNVGFDKSITLVITRKEDTDLLWYLDADNDGYAHPTTVLSPTSPGADYSINAISTTDCDDANPAINPETVWYLDGDGDGYADPTTVESCENPGTGYTTDVLPTTDCDDNDVTVHESVTWYLDGDGDGYADSTTVDSCQSPGTGYATDVLPTTDCDDNDAAVHESVRWYLDGDGDGYANLTTLESCQSPGLGYTTDVLPTTDCDDNDAAVYESVTWYLDGDGDGYADPTTVDSCQSPGTGYATDVLPTTDCDDNDAAVYESVIWYLDGDGDGYANPTTMDSCQNPGTGYTSDVLPTTDCDDDDSAVHESVTWYLDSDGDGYADPITIDSCQNPGPGYNIDVLPTTDCDDNDAAVHESVTWYLDRDGDGYADSTTVDSCQNPGTGYTIGVLPTTDCDDGNVNINPTTLWYIDSDQDGFADDEPILSCMAPSSEYIMDELPIKEIVTPEDGILYPNPSRNEVYVDLSKTYDKLQVEVLSPERKVVIKKSFDRTNHIALSMDGQQTGIYFLHIMSEGKRIGFFKIIKL